MGKALYRTYRSKKLSEIVGQEHITLTLANALKEGMVSHAYLFTGPRGVGKTSIARILAHEINQLDYTSDQTHLDIIEIDAASNRRIDEIRELRDKVHIAPASAKYKVYIIDEVHMLTREAFNALLKTLEEPPAHAIFILATTEAHKLPETIVSRTQRFTFKPVEKAKVKEHLAHIAKQEKFSIDDEALDMIAAHGEGSFRDSISLLDQMRNLGHKVTADDVQQILGVAPAALIESLISAVSSKNPNEAVQLLIQLKRQGSAASQVAKQLGKALRTQLLGGESGLPSDEIIKLLTKLLDVPASHNPQELLEIILIDAALTSEVQPGIKTPSADSASDAGSSKKTSAPVTVAPAKPAKTASAATKKPAQIAPEIPSKPAKSEVGTKFSEVSDDDAPENNSPVLDTAIWPQIVNSIKQNYNTLYGLIKTAEPHFEPGLVKLEVGYAFHQKRLSENRNKQILIDTIRKVSGQEMQISCELGKPKTQKLVLPPASDSEIVHNIKSSGVSSANAEDQTNEADDDVDYYVSQAEKASARPMDTVSNIFGGGELLGT